MIVINLLPDYKESFFRAIQNIVYSRVKVIFLKNWENRI